MVRLPGSRAARPGHDGDRFAALWDSYAQRIYSYCFRRTADAALAEDLASIVFLEAWRRRNDVEVESEKALPWLYGIATNVLRNQRRRQRRYTAALQRLHQLGVEPDFADVSDGRLDDEQRMRHVLDHLQELSQLDREVLALCVWQELSPADAAQALDVPEATIRTRLHRARAHLREQTAPFELNRSSDAASRCQERPELT